MLAGAGPGFETLKTENRKEDIHTPDTHAHGLADDEEEEGVDLTWED